MIDELEDKQVDFFAQVERTLVSLTSTALIIFVVPVIFPEIEPPAIIGGAEYTFECKTFRENASKAGTAKIAAAELTKAINCLETNQLTQSFEYEDLKANLDYLKKQPNDLIVLPDAIRNSIKQSSENIEYRKNKPISKKAYVLWFAIVFTVIRVSMEVMFESWDS